MIDFVSHRYSEFALALRRLVPFLILYNLQSTFTLAIAGQTLKT